MAMETGWFKAVIYAEKIKAYGHPNIKGTHRTTFEITTEEELTPRGDCIIGVKADKSAADLSNEFKQLAQRKNTVIIIVLKADEYKDIVLASGHQNLIIMDKQKIIVRKSTYIEPATIAVKANKAARDINRKLIEKLRDPRTVLETWILLLDLNEIKPIDINVGGIV